MLNEETVENYKVIEKLVHDKFDLTDESQALFSKLLYEHTDAIEFEKIASQPDRRLFIKDALPAREGSDVPWSSFKKYFPTFSENISYSDFVNGRVGERKLMTFFLETSSKDLNCLKELIVYIKNNSSALFEMFSKGYYPKNHVQIMENFAHCEVKKTTDGKLGMKIGKKTFKKKFNEKETTIVLKELKTPISELLNKDFFGTKRPAGKTICFSLNFADWFLASTGESWWSCVDFNSDVGNWRGLPGLVGDSNRLLVFVTDGTEKTFNKVKSLKMIERTWAFLYKNAEGKKVLCPNRTYPSGSFDFKPFKEYFTKDLGYEMRNTNMISLYMFPTIFHKPLDKDMVALSASITEDTHSKKLNPKNINESYYDTSNGYGVYTYAIKKDGSFTKHGCNKTGIF